MDMLGVIVGGVWVGAVVFIGYMMYKGTKEIEAMEKREVLK